MSVLTIFKGRDRLSPSITRLQKKALGFTAGFSKGLRTMDGHLGKVHGALKKVATGIGIAGAAIGTGLGWAAKSGLSFEQAISRVGAVSLKSRGEIQDLEKKALELGRTTKFTATESASAMEVMARAGFSNAEILQGIGGIMAAAAAEGADMAETTSHVSNVLKGMGLQATDTAKVADVLALASARTNSTIGSLGESMKNLSPVARQFGIGMEDAVGMVALLQDVGLDASEAGTATATMLTKLAKPADAVAKKMEGLGIAFKNSEGNMLAPIEIFQNMQAASDRLGGNMDTVAFFADLVGLRGQKAALNLQDLFTSEKGTTLTKELREATGTAQKMADISMDNTLGSWTLFSSAIDGVKVALFNLNDGALKETIDKATAWVTANQELIVSGVKEFIADLADALPTIVTWLERIGKTVAVFYLFSTAVKVATVAMGIFNAIMAANPWVLLVYGIVAAIALIWAFWPEISAFFGKMWAGITSFASKISTAVGNFFGSIVDAVKPFFVGLFEFIVGWLTIVTLPYRLAFQGFVALASWVAEKIKAFFAPVGTFFSNLWADIGYFASDVWNGIVALASGVATRIKEFFQPLVSFFSGLWDSIASGFKAALGWVLEKVQWLIDKGAWLVDKVRGVGRDQMDGDPSNDLGANVFSPQERVSRSIEEQRNHSTAEVTIKDQTGRAHVSKPPSGPGVGLRLDPTGAY